MNYPLTYYSSTKKGHSPTLYPAFVWLGSGKPWSLNFGRSRPCPLGYKTCLDRIIVDSIRLNVPDLTSPNNSVCKLCNMSSETLSCFFSSLSQIKEYFPRKATVVSDFLS